MQESAASAAGRTDAPELEKCFGAMFRQMSVGAALVAADGRWMKVNAHLCTLLGYREEELLDSNFQAITAPQDAAASAAALSRLASGEIEDARMEQRYVCKDGRELWADLTITRIEGGQRQPPCFLALISDITATKARERELRESEDRYRDLVENSRDLICIHDLQGTLLSVNRAALEILGYGPHEMVGRNLGEFGAPKSVAALPAYLQEIREHGKAEGVLSMKTAAGSVRYLQYRNTLRSTGLPAPIVRGMAQDITERLRAEKALARRDAVLGAVGRIAQRLLLTAGMAPAELRNILGEIGAAADASRVYLFQNLDAAGGALTSRQIEEWTAPEIEPFLQDPALQAFCWRDFGSEAIAASLESGAGVFAHREQLPGRFADLLARQQVKSVALVPVFVDQHWWGFLGFDACLAARDWDAGEREALFIVAATLGAAVQRDRAKNKVLESDAKFRALVEQSLVGIFMMDDERVIYANPRAADIFQYQPGELAGMPVETLVSEDDLPAARQQITLLYRAEQQVAKLEYRARRKDGTLVMVGAQGVLVHIGGSPFVIGVMQDISGKVQAERDIRRYMAKLEAAFMSTVQVATTLSEMRDPYTAGHERRVGEMAAAIAAEMGLDTRRQEGLRVAGFLHDVGKIIIPSDILSKPGKLSAAEFQLIKGHAEASYEVLKDVDFPWPVAEVALQHHERMDGSGYPRGLKGDEILMESRIMAVADVVEAMSSHRPYRAGLGVEAALAEVERGLGTIYDAGVAIACLRLFREKGYKLPA